MLMDLSETDKSLDQRVLDLLFEGGHSLRMEACYHQSQYL